MTKLTLYFIGAAVLLIALGVLTWNFDPFSRRKHAEQKAAVATEQAASQTEAVKQLDHYTNTVTVIREKQDAAVQSVQSAPGASESVPDGVLAGWRSAIDGMRDKPSAPPATRP